jgi:acyl carrier protein phosphodiesterase
MNYLGHALYSPDDALIRVANIISDEFKIHKFIPDNEKILQGQTRHRFIDGFCDRDSGYKVVRQICRKEFGKFAPVVVDVFYDHFLARHFDQLTGRSLKSFTAVIYQDIYTAASNFPTEIISPFVSMAEAHWLDGYIFEENVYRSIRHIERKIHQRFGRRVSFGAALGIYYRNEYQITDAFRQTHNSIVKIIK